MYLKTRIKVYFGQRKLQVEHQTNSAKRIAIVIEKRSFNQIWKIAIELKCPESKHIH